MSARPPPHHAPPPGSGLLPRLRWFRDLRRRLTMTPVAHVRKSHFQLYFLHWLIECRKKCSEMSLGLRAGAVERRLPGEQRSGAMSPGSSLACTRRSLPTFFGLWNL